MYFYRQARVELEEQIIEVAEHLFKKGMKEDSTTYDGFSTVKLAIDSGNINLALWLINNLCDGDIPEDVFKTSDQNMNNQPFLFKLTDYSSELDWESLIKLLIKRAKKNQLHDLLDINFNGQNALINLMTNRPSGYYRNNDQIKKYEDDMFLKHLDLILEMAKACNFDISTEIKYNKQYDYSVKDLSNDAIAEFFKTIDEEKVDQKVNGFGLVNLSLNESDLLYFDESSGIYQYNCGNVKSNLLHSLIRNAGNENAIIGG